MEGEKPVGIHVQVHLTAGNAFFGPGAGHLLSQIQKTGSIQQACREMELSYSKGSKLIKNIEEHLGYPVVERFIGGSHGGGSRLTKEGVLLLENYQKIVSEIERYAEMIFPDYFGG